MSRVLALAAVVLVGVADQKLSTQYAPERAFRVEATTTLKMETTASRFERDGEPVDRGGRGGGGAEMTRHAIHVDRVLAADEGRPTKVRRAFEEVAATASVSFGGESRELESDCPLSGAVIELTADGDDVEVEAVEGSPPAEALEGHRPRLALDALLPEGEVAVDGSWTLGNEAIRRALGLDVAKALFPPPAPPEDGGGERGGRGGGRGMRGGGDGRLLEQAEWEGKATLAALDDEHEGQACARIEIEIEASGELPEPQFGGFGGGRGGAFQPEGRALVLRENTYEIRLEGKLLFALETRLPVLLELEGQARHETKTERTVRDSTIYMETTREGALQHRVTVSRHEE
jgi:hypothetical protein